MFSKRFLGLSAAALLLAGGFATEAQAGHRPSRDFCREIVQTVKIGRHIRYSEYGTACSERGTWIFVSERPHPRRYGNGFYFRDHGHYVPVYNIHSPRKHYYRHDRDWDRHDRHDRWNNWDNDHNHGKYRRH